MRPDLQAIPDGIMVSSLRRRTTSRQCHELPLLPVALDVAGAVATLKLSPDQMVTLMGNQSETTTIVGDLRLNAGGGDIHYFGPYRFDLAPAPDC